MNITPDSFSDGGQFYGDGNLDEEKLAEAAKKMLDDGADIIDLGGESTGPNSKNVELEEELRRVIPAVRIVAEVIEKYDRKTVTGSLPGARRISVDTYKAEVARQAIEAGANMINDVTAFRGSTSDGARCKMAELLAEKNLPLVIMYAKDSTARTTRENRQYVDIVKTIKDFWNERIEFGLSHGMKREQFMLDPGMGAFVSTDSRYSLEILRRLKEFQEFKLPILIGASRKGFIGEVLAENGVALPVSERLEGSLACAAIAVMNGAQIIRAHDVKETLRVVRMVEMMADSC